MKINLENKKWPKEETDSFYKDLLKKALDSIPETGAVMVLGPMFVLNSPEENFKIFNEKANELSEKGITVFNQVPFVDYVIKDAPFDYERKFELFYKELIKSGKITEIYLLPGWEHSKGTQTEIKYAQEMNLNINYPKN